MAGDAAAGKAEAEAEEAEAEARAEAARGQLEAAGLALGLTAGATLAVVALVEAVRNRLGAGLALPLWAAPALALAPAALAALLLCGAPRPGRAPCSPRLLALGALLLALGAACSSATPARLGTAIAPTIAAATALGAMPAAGSCEPQELEAGTGT